MPFHIERVRRRRSFVNRVVVVLADVLVLASSVRLRLRDARRGRSRRLRRGLSLHGPRRLELHRLARDAPPHRHRERAGARPRPWRRTRRSPPNDAWCRGRRLVTRQPPRAQPARRPRGRRPRSTSRRTPRAPRRPSWTRARARDAAGPGFRGRARRTARGARRDGARREFRDVPTAEPGGKQARAVARRARGARGEIEPREVLERVAAGRRRGGAARRAGHVHEHAPHVGRVREGTDGRLRNRETAESRREMKFKVSQTAPAPRRSVCPEKESQLCRSRSRERQRPPDRHTRRRGRRYVERASAFLRGASVSPSPRERIFSKRPAGGTASLASTAACQLFQDLPRSSPALFRSRAGAVSIERELPHGRVAIRPASEPSTATTPDASRPSSPRPLTRR